MAERKSKTSTVKW